MSNKCSSMIGVFILALFSCAIQSPLARATTTETGDLVIGRSGMVSAGHPRATQAGVEILQAGGNAFDAAVAVAATLNVVEPMNSGMGGYGTILVYDAKGKKTRFLNCSDRIPRSVNANMFRAPSPNFRQHRRGAKAVSTPGNVPAWWAMSNQYGKLIWKELFAPAIKTAEEGFVLDERMAAVIGRSFSTFPEHAKAFYGHAGKPLQAGERLVQHDLARSLRLVARNGPDALRDGTLGHAIDRAMRDAGGFLNLGDLKEATATWWEPIAIDYRGHKVYTASPPSTAFPSLIRLGLMSQYDAASLGHNTPAYLHRFAEATKHAFWCRLRYAGSPRHNMPPLDRLLSPSYWRETVATFDSARAKPFSPPTSFADEGKNTTHFVVADRWGNIVSATQTLGNSFGSRIMPEGTGIWLNNSLAYCTFEPPGNPMDAHAGRYKLSGDCPTIIMREGRPWAAIGTPGGHTIGQTVPQMVMNLIDFGMNVDAAIAAARVSFIEPNTLAVEAGIDNRTVSALRAMGHEVRTGARLGNAHGLTIEYDNAGKIARFTGASDPRGKGLAKGY